jgi:hypothetical protein
MTRYNRAVSFGEVAARIVLAMILAERDDPAEFRARVEIARGHGHLTDEQAADLLAQSEVVA